MAMKVSATNLVHPVSNALKWVLLAVAAVEKDGNVAAGSFTDKIEAERNRQRVPRHFEKERSGYGDPWTVELASFTPT